MVKAVIFDLDDTLISERQYIESGYRHIAALLSCDIGITKDNIYEDLISLLEQSPINVFNRLLVKYNINFTQDKIMDLVNEYRNHFPSISFYEDVKPCLEQLKEKEIKTGIITDGYSISQKQKLKAVKADDYFNEIIITDDLGREYWKPHPKAFELIKDRLSVEFDEMIYVGDNPEKDFYISSVYPLTTIRIHRKGIYKNKRYKDEVREKYHIFSLNELISLVDMLNKLSNKC